MDLTFLLLFPVVALLAIGVGGLMTVSYDYDHGHSIEKRTLWPILGALFLAWVLMLTILLVAPP